MAWIVVLIVLGFVGLRAMAEEERAKLFRTARAVVQEVKDAASVSRAQCVDYRAALKARTNWPLVTFAIAALHVAVFGFMVVRPGSLADPQTLVGWGANHGPLTTNGQWWRLLTSLFVPGGFFELLIDVACLVQLGIILERLLGPAAFAGAYFSSGIFASLVSLTARPLGVSTGSSGAVFGLYGLLVAPSIWLLVYRSTVTMPRAAVKQLIPGGLVFVLYNIGSDSLASSAELTGFAVGCLCGIVLVKGVSDATPPIRRVGVAAGAAFVMAIAVAVPLRGVTDARPEIERVVAVEARTSSAYQSAMDQLKKRRITAEALAQLIDRTIMPQLQAADARLKSLGGVPREQEELVAHAADYLRLRSESWRLRADVLRKTNALSPKDTGGDDGSGSSSRLKAEAQYKAYMITRGKAEGSERASLEALQKIAPAAAK